MHAKLKTAAKDIKDKVKGSAKVVNKDFKGLLKEDKKLDASRDKMSKLLKMKKGC